MRGLGSSTLPSFRQIEHVCDECGTPTIVDDLFDGLCMSCYDMVPLLDAYQRGDEEVLKWTGEITYPQFHRAIARRRLLADLEK